MADDFDMLPSTKGLDSIGEKFGCSSLTHLDLSLATALKINGERAFADCSPCSWCGHVVTFGSGKHCKSKRSGTVRVFDSFGHVFNGRIGEETFSGGSEKNRNSHFQRLFFFDTSRLVVNRGPGKHIGDEAFMACSSLNKIVEINAFADCSSLTHVDKCRQQRL